MKFIIAKSTVLAGNKENDTINAAIASAFGLPAPHKHTDGIVELENEFENFSVTLIDGNYEFEMNDECVLKFMRLYAKAAKLVMPLVKAIVGMLEDFKADADEIAEFIGKRKAPAVSVRRSKRDAFADFTEA